MPKIIDYNPQWLSRPSPGFQLFNTAKHSSTPAQPTRRGSAQRENGNSYEGPVKTIAHRGTEVFLVAGKDIRWSDLSILKNEYEELQATPSKKPKPTTDGDKRRSDEDGPEDGSYRVLKVSVGEPIRQLSISPNGNLLAIATSHTVHLALLPDSSLFGQLPNKAIKLKTYTVGPTTHVLSQSQVTSILWHTYGVAGNCFVTITADAVVRLWEFNQDNRWSSDSPSLAVDLKKLVTGTSEEDNFVPDRFGRNRSFSSDALGLEVASACFGGGGLTDESAWSAMTLWLGMKGGDIYALCPLLPSKWQPSSTLLPSLSSTIVEKATLHQEEGAKDALESRQYRDQYDWIQDLDKQEPTLTKAEDDSSPELEIYSRPSHPGPIPRLQGPFQMFSEEVGDDLELSDIHVIAGKLNPDEFMSNDESDSEADWLEEHGISGSIVCLMTRSGRVYVCLDLEGVEGQWLPRKKPSHQLPPPKDPYLVVLEGLDTLKSSELLDLEWPTFSQDVDSRYSFFVTHSNGVFFFSLDPWVQSLEKELQSYDHLGASFRMNIIKNGPGTLREAILSFNQDQDTVSQPPVPACLVFQDTDLGYFLLTAVNGKARAATLDNPHPEPVPKFEDVGEETYVPDMNVFTPGPPRQTYQAPDVFFADSSLPSFLKSHVQTRHQRLMREEIRLSTMTLDLMTQVHRVISQETHKLGLAAADLFRRCERLRDELRDQISRANEVAQRTERIADEDANACLGSSKGKDHPRLDQRLQNVRSKHEELAARHEALRRKFSKHGGNELGKKEELWISEVRQTQESIAAPDPEHEEDEEMASEMWQRCREARDLADDLIARAKESSQDDSQTNDEDTHMIPLDLRKAKVTQVMKLLERESALVEAAQARLKRLSLSTIS